MLADVSLQDMNCTSLTVDDTKWTVVVSRKVAIAMDDTLAQSWQSRGQQRFNSPNGRSLLALLPRQGHVPGIAIIAVYAPHFADWCLQEGLTV